MFLLCICALYMIASSSISAFSNPFALASCKSSSYERIPTPSFSSIFLYFSYSSKDDSLSGMTTKSGYNPSFSNASSSPGFFIGVFFTGDFFFILEFRLFILCSSLFADGLYFISGTSQFMSVTLTIPFSRFFNFFFLFCFASGFGIIESIFFRSL